MSNTDRIEELSGDFTKLAQTLEVLEHSNRANKGLLAQKIKDEMREVSDEITRLSDEDRTAELDGKLTTLDSSLKDLGFIDDRGDVRSVRQRG